MALLCIKLIKGELDILPQNQTEYYVTVKVENLKARSDQLAGPHPLWNQEFFFEISRDIDLGVEIEIWEKGFLWDKILGSMMIPYSNIRFSNTEGDGQWKNLGMEKQTNHKILLEVRFETGPDLTLEEVLFVQNSFQTNWRVNALENIQFEYESSNIRGTSAQSDDSQYHSEDQRHPQSPMGHEDAQKIDEIPECDQNTFAKAIYENNELGSETESRLSDSRRSPPRKFTKEDFDVEPELDEARYHQDQPIINNDHMDIVQKSPKSEPRLPSHEDVSAPMNVIDEQKDHCENTVEILVEDATFSAAKFRWIQAVNKIRLKLRTSEIDQGGTDEKLRKSNWGAQAIASNFLSSIDSMPNFKPRRKSIPLVSELSAALMLKNKSGISSVLIGRQNQDNELKLHVYRKGLQALVYPISNTTPHSFEIYSAPRPVYCDECRGFLWGVARQGMRCTECRVICHEKCKDLINADCLQRAAERTSKKDALVEQTQRIITVMNNIMKTRIESNPEVFEILRRTFDISPDDHIRALNGARQSILDGTSQWRAKLSITVHSAQGLQAKDKTGFSDPYVTVQIGNLRKRTKTIHRELNPEWNEKFQFECANSTDRIKVRVWDEDNDIKSKVKARILRESDDFLGQCVIEVRTLSGDNELWYNLEKRSEKSAVSGAIKLSINCEIKGEEKLAPYHVQYTALHENLFLFTCSESEHDVPNLPLLRKGDEKGDDSFHFFDEPAHDIVSEFGVRYGIESIYGAMTHFSCLATKYMCQGVPSIMTQLLEHIIEFYTSTTFTQITPSKRFSSSNFGSGRFLRLLEQLHNSLRIDISSYRENFPATNKTRLHDLNGLVNLLHQIGNFKSKVMGANALIENVFRECIKACANTTYTYIFNNCNQLHAREFGEEQKAEPALEKDKQGPDMHSLDFWVKLCTLSAFIIEEDKTIYSREMNILSIDLTAISSIEIWNLYIHDLGFAMEEHAQTKNCTTTEYMNLQFKVKWLFKEYVSKLPEYADVPPEYPSLFEPFTLDWLEENESISLKFLHGAYERDKKENFAVSTDMSLFSCSVVDIFTQMNQSYEVIRKLDCPDPEVLGQYMSRFSTTVEKVLIDYFKLIKDDFGQYCHDEERACILMNNVQQSRIQLEKMYEMMGGNDLHENAQTILNELQNKLINRLDQLAAIFGESFLPRITEGVKQLSILLLELKQSSEDQIETDCDHILSPLLCSLDESFELFSQSAEKTVLKRILKSLWKILLQTIEKYVVLPSAQGNALFNAGSRALEMGKKIGSNLKTSALSGTLPISLSGTSLQPSNLTLGMESKTLAPYHCSVMECAIENMKIYFHSEGMGLKKSYLNKSAELQSLMYALSLYTLSTDNLIKRFMDSSIDKEPESFGEVNLMIELKQNPGADKLLNVKVLTAEGLQYKATSFRPYISLDIIGPGMKNFKRTFSTKSLSNQWSPKFNQQFSFSLPSTEPISSYLLQVTCRDYCLMSNDKVIGLSSIRLNEVQDQGTCAVWVTLAKREKFDDTGWTILRILSQRSADPLAKDFVKLKTQQRDE